jgi:hypothetical protein
MAGFVSPLLRIRFHPGTGPDNLTILGPDGERFLTFTEWVERSKAEQRQADAADARANEQSRSTLVERQRADQERRFATAAADLLELDHEPESA